MFDYIPPCPSTISNECVLPEDYVMYYHIKNENIGDNFYEYVNGAYKFVGEYTGYSTRPTHRSHGRIQLDNNGISSIFIACKATYCPDIGWVITEKLEG